MSVETVTAATLCSISFKKWSTNKLKHTNRPPFPSQSMVVKVFRVQKLSVIGKQGLTSWKKGSRAAAKRFQVHMHWLINYSETIPQYNRQLSPEFKPKKYNDYYDEKNYVYQPIVLPSPPKTEIVAVGLENDNAFANKKPLDWEYVQRKTKFLTDRAKEKSDQLEWRLKQLEFENKKLLGLIPADQNLESEDQTNAVKRTKSELNSLKAITSECPKPRLYKQRGVAKSTSAQWELLKECKSNVRCIYI